MTTPMLAVCPALSLAAALALLMLCGGIIHSDFTRRQIPNAYCAAIVALSAMWWIGQGGWSGLVTFAQQVFVAVLLGIPLLLLFALRVFAGGDVKLILALVLWVPVQGIGVMLVVTVLCGGLLAIVLAALHRVFCAVRADSVPYGIPIIAGAMLILIPEIRDVLNALPSVHA